MEESSVSNQKIMEKQFFIENGYYMHKHIINVKVAMVGDSQIGKTSLMVKYYDHAFNQESVDNKANEIITSYWLRKYDIPREIGGIILMFCKLRLYPNPINVMKKRFEIKSCTAQLDTYDLDAQYQIHDDAAWMSTALENAKGIIFVFDLSKKASLLSIKRWYKESRKLNKAFKSMLVGTKYDLFEQKDNEYKSELTKLARHYAKKMKSPLIMCSSKASANVRQVFNVAIACIFQIRTWAKQKHKELEEPILEYDRKLDKNHWNDKVKTSKKKKKKKRKQNETQSDSRPSH